MEGSLKRIVTLSKRNAKEIVRDPLSLLFMTGLPLLLEILFYFIFHSMTSQFDMKYLAPGIAVFAQSFTTLFAGLLIAVDRGTSFLTRLYVSKARSYEFILSYMAALLPFTFVQAVLFFVVGGIIDPGFWSFSMIPAVFLCMVVALFFIGAGILIGSVCNEKSIGGVASILIAGQSLLSGMWFPVEGLQGTMLNIMDALPFRNATQLIQHAVNGYGDLFGDIIRPLLIVLGYTVAVFVVAVWLFKRQMKKA